MKKIVGILLLGFLGLTLNAQDVEKYGVVDGTQPEGAQVGDTIVDLTLHFLNGKEGSLYDLSMDRPTVILFYRGEWCPVCNKYLSNLSDSLGMIQEKANVIVISPETKANMEKTQKSHPEYTYVLDEEEEIMLAFDVLFDVTKKYQKKIKTFLWTDIAEHNDEKKARLPVPATFIVDANGVILYRHFEYDYGIRATALEILTHL
jgi:peroxiredoxin